MIEYLKMLVNGRNPSDPDFKTVEELQRDSIDLQYLADLSTFGASGIFGKEENLSILEGLIERKANLLSDENVRDIVKIALLEPSAAKANLLNLVASNSVAVKRMSLGDGWKKILTDAAYANAHAAKEAIIAKKVEEVTLPDLQFIFTTAAVKEFINGKTALINKIYQSDVVLARVIGNNIWDIPNLTQKITDNGDAIWERVKAINDTNKFGYREQSQAQYFSQGSTMQQMYFGGLAYVTEVRNEYQGNSSYPQIQHIDLYRDQAGTTRLTSKITISSSSTPTTINKWVANAVYYTCTHENPNGTTQGFMQMNRLYYTKVITGKGGWS